MEDQIIFIFSLCDDLLASFGTNKDAQCKMNFSEVMTVAIVAASVADITALKIMEMDLAPGSVVYGDKAHTDYTLEDYLEGIEKIRLTPDRKTNLKRQHPGCICYLQSILRKRIETTFSQLVSLFPRKIHGLKFLKILATKTPNFRSLGIIKNKMF